MIETDYVKFFRQ